MKFGRVRFRVKKLVVTKLDAGDQAEVLDKNSNMQPISARNSSRLHLDMVNDRRFSEMSIGQDT